jgi:hypothetical protein
MKSYEIIPEIHPMLPEHIKGWRLKLYIGNTEIDGGEFNPGADGYTMAFQKAEQFITDDAHFNFEF